ncbi:uncharacterized protein LOC119385899 [Rhipicephalus sanguineus]|uniref:uncharacterized protein LOC119385899 n=1 Tax=Rhipicephalus sanguineus TaxID=34632 RepID=UPI0018941AD9|nr:uncharacterized protein LOC119385899 [Rhipicephalus sanguineus]
MRGQLRDESGAWLSAHSFFQGVGGSTETLTSTGIFTTAPLTLNPATADAAAVPQGPGRVRQPRSTHGLPPPGGPSPQPLQARLAPFWAFHNLLYGIYGSQQSQTSTSGEEVVKGHALRNKGIGGLYIALVTLALCAFIWLVTAATLSSQASALGAEADEAEEEPVAVLRLEDSSAPLPFIRLRDESRIFDAAHTPKTKDARVTDATVTPEVQETSGATTEENTGVGTTREASVVGQDKSFGGVSMSRTTGRSSKRARRFHSNKTGSGKSASKKRRKLYPRRHIHRRKPTGAPTAIHDATRVPPDSQRDLLD